MFVLIYYWLCHWFVSSVAEEHAMKMSQDRAMWKEPRQLSGVVLGSGTPLVIQWRSLHTASAGSQRTRCHMPQLRPYTTVR